MLDVFYGKLRTFCGGLGHENEIETYFMEAQYDEEISDGIIDGGCVGHRGAS